MPARRRWLGAGRVGSAGCAPVRVRELGAGPGRVARHPRPRPAPARPARRRGLRRPRRPALPPGRADGAGRAPGHPDGAGRAAVRDRPAAVVVAGAVRRAGRVGRRRARAVDELRALPSRSSTAVPRPGPPPSCSPKGRYRPGSPFPACTSPTPTPSPAARPPRRHARRPGGPAGAPGVAGGRRAFGRGRRGRARYRAARRGRPRVARRGCARRGGAGCARPPRRRRRARPRGRADAPGRRAAPPAGRRRAGRPSCTPSWAARFPREVLTAVGVLDGFAVVVDEEPVGPDHDLDDEDRWWDGLAEPPTRLVAVRDLDLVDDPRGPPPSPCSRPTATPARPP